ncbi:MAG: TrmH family RNA methyltransferase [Flavobacteriaceae bacterium]|nr:TrmH family RNA methyltransferase [Flavobacteriaceae bacterium]
MSVQLTHDENRFTETNQEIILFTDGVNSPANIGSLFRLADAFGVKEVVFTGTKVDFNSSRLRKTARNTEKHICHRVITDISTEISKLKSSGFKLIGLEITNTSKAIQNIRTSGEKVALFLGGEQHGLSQECLEQMDEIYHIEMFGLNSSMNVTHAAAIGLFCLTANPS